MIQESFFSKESVQGLGPLNQPIYGIEEILENEKTRKPANLYPKDFDLQKDNLLICGDNAEVMQRLLEMNGGKPFIDLIYIDPPFCSERNYDLKNSSDRGFRDKWEGGLPTYLAWLNARLLEMKRVLKKSGSLFVHLDWHACHYVKAELDKIFGHEHFVNEIIWSYKSGGASSSRFSRKHDTILFYGKTKSFKFSPMKEKSYNRGFKPYRFKGVKEYEDDLGWYTLVNMKDVWEIDMVGRSSKERIGYPTQKPESLLARIVNSCTHPGDVVADLFVGSGTTCAVAQKLGRRWIGVDQNPQAIEVAANRIKKLDSKFKIVEQR